MEQPWNITVKILRQKGMDGKPYYQSYSLQIHPDEYVLDAVEKIWAFQDRTLTFRHACHHATCGACGMRVNGVEKLTCITSIYSMTKNNGVLRIEPLRNFPVLSDLVVDMSDLYNHMEAAGFTQVASLETACLPFEKSTQTIPGQTFERLVDCIECGMCISACPSSHTSSTYQGPAALAAIQHTLCKSSSDKLINQADHENGVWRCHSAFECSAVCPSHVDPAWRIMNLRRRVIGYRWKNFFMKSSQEDSDEK